MEESKIEMWQILQRLNERYRLTTCYSNDSSVKNKAGKPQDFYAKMTNPSPETGDMKTFENDTPMFVVALLIGYIHNKRSDKWLPENSHHRYAFSRMLLGNTPEVFRHIFQLVFFRTFPEPDDEYFKKFMEEIEGQHASWNREDKKRMAVWRNFCSYADGGIEILLEDYEKHGKIKLKEIVDELASKIDEQIPSLIEGLNQK